MIIWSATSSMRVPCSCSLGTSITVSTLISLVFGLSWWRPTWCSRRVVCVVRAAAALYAEAFKTSLHSITTSFTLRGLPGQASLLPAYLARVFTVVTEIASWPGRGRSSHP